MLTLEWVQPDLQYGNCGVPSLCGVELKCQGFATVPKGLAVTEHFAVVFKPESSLKSLPLLPDIFLADPELVSELPGCTCNE